METRWDYKAIIIYHGGVISLWNFFVTDAGILIYFIKFASKFSYFFKLDGLAPAVKSIS